MFDMGDGVGSLDEGVARVQCPVLILGVTSDILFPVEQQREMAEKLKTTGQYTTMEFSLILNAKKLSVLIFFCFQLILGNPHTTYYELTSIYGHDTFMLDVSNVGVAIKVCSISCVVYCYAHEWFSSRP